VPILKPIIPYGKPQKDWSVRRYITCLSESRARSEEEKPKTFADHLSKVFKPNPREIMQEEENRLLYDDITLDHIEYPYKALYC